jgi:hypothetical protein
VGLGCRTVVACVSENSKLIKEVEELKVVIFRLKTKKKMHKAEMHYKDTKDVAFIVMFCACIVYAVVAICVR